MFYNLYEAIKQRLERLLTASSLLTMDATAGSSFLYCSDLSDFGEDNFVNKYNQIILMDKNTTGQRIENGYSGTEIVNVKTINYTENWIELESPLTRSWTVLNESKIKLCPAGMVIYKVYVGDINVAKDFPCISVNPISQSTEWVFFQGTKESIVIDFNIYVKDATSETSTKDVMRLTDVVNWILMSNMHIVPKDQEQPTSKSMVKDIKYGTIQKGSTFLKASTLTWNADLYLDRWYVYGKEKTKE